MIRSLLLGALAAVLGSLALPLTRYRRLGHDPWRNVRPRLPPQPVAPPPPAREELEPVGQYERVLGAALWLCSRAPFADERAAHLALVLVRAAADARGLALGEPEAALWPRQLRLDLFVLVVDAEEHDDGERLAPTLGQAITILGELAERPWVRRELLRAEL